MFHLQVIKSDSHSLILKYATACKTTDHILIQNTNPQLDNISYKHQLKKNRTEFSHNHAKKGKATNYLVQWTEYVLNNI